MVYSAKKDLILQTYTRILKQIELYDTDFIVGIV